MIRLAKLDWNTAPLAVREAFALEPGAVQEFLRQVSAADGVAGCILLQTCNRFELYAETGPGFGESLPALCARLLENPQGEELLSEQREKEATLHLCQVACGLHSQILGEDQIITQVRTAPEPARKAGTTTPVLETLFRTAVTAGKTAKTKVKLDGVPQSSVSRAVELAQTHFGSLDGKTAVVIGNGEMGRAAASLLVDAGCDVTVTLRSYRHGETVVPKGCGTVSYDQRLAALDGCDLLVSATKSPHYTLSRAMLETVARPPGLIADIAVPRDIDPDCHTVDGIRFLDMDDLVTQNREHNAQAMGEIHQIIQKHLDDFTKWQQGREKYARKPKPGKLAVFAGTSEGRELCRHLSRCGVPATLCVATEYGRTVLEPMDGITVHTGRMDAEQMQEFLDGFAQVVDATHPYAAVVSQNLRQVCQTLGIQYLRLVRPASGADGQMVTVENSQKAAEFLAKTQGPVLLTTGSKELDAYTSVPGYQNRLFARVLPDAGVLESCAKLGFAPKNIIGMQGPFSHRMNLALLEQTGARWLVTKDTGNPGGLQQKLSAAAEWGAGVVMIARPVEETGCTLEQLERLLTGCESDPPLAGEARFPLFIDLQNKPVLVVGGGKIAARRAKVLAGFGAELTCVAAQFKEEFPKGVLRRRPYEKGDCRGMALVVAATDSRETNSRIAKECHREHIPVSVADAPGECSFFFPAICQSQHLTAGLVSDGGHHNLTAQTAARIRTLMEEADPWTR